MTGLPGRTPTRSIVIYCDGGADRSGEARHAARNLATLETVDERWPAEMQAWQVREDSAHGEVQQIGHPDDAGGTSHSLAFRAMTGGIARRSQIRCPDCGLDATFADRLGQVGYSAILEGKAVVVEQRSLTSRERLSTLADGGVSRLSLAALGRILTE